MNVNLLIDAIVRQTTVLIAHLATAAGARATLAHTANQVFVDLVRELKDQGLGNKVIADMFGLSLRTYHNKIARLSESSTDRGKPLWEALLEHIQERGSVLRAEVLTEFSRDDEATVRAVLHDLVDSGIVFRTGRGDATTYRAAALEEMPRMSPAQARERLSAMLWVTINRFGPATADDLADHIPAPRADLDSALESLERDGRIRRQPPAADEPAPRFVCDECVIPMGDPVGWEAAVFDHYQAMVTAIGTKLRLGAMRAVPGEWVGGSTYGFDVWEGHPHRDEVLGFLQSTRERAVALRAKVERFNADNERPQGEPTRVIAYVGQTIIGPETDEEEQ